MITPEKRASMIDCLSQDNCSGTLLGININLFGVRLQLTLNNIIASIELTPLYGGESYEFPFLPLEINHDATIKAKMGGNEIPHEFRESLQEMQRVLLREYFSRDGIKLEDFYLDRTLHKNYGIRSLETVKGQLIAFKDVLF